MDGGQREILTLILAVTICFSAVLMSGVGAATNASGYYSPTQEEAITVEGVAIKIFPDNIDLIPSIFSKRGVDVDGLNFYRLYTSDNRSYIVATNRDIETEPVRISGRLIEPYDHGDSNFTLPGLIVETDHQELSYSPTITPTQLMSGGLQYAGTGVRVDGSFTGISATYDYQGTKIPITGGLLGEELSQGFSLPESTNIRTSRKIILKSSAETHETIEEYPDFDTQFRTQRNFANSVRSDLPTSRSWNLPNTKGKYQKRFWTSGEASTSVTVEPIIDYEDTVYHTTKTRLTDADEVRSLSDIATHPEASGEVVFFRANYIGSSMSMKEAILSTNSCGSESAVTSYGCIPIFLDTTVHTGIAYETGSTGRSAIPVFGLSNYDQDSLRTAERGRYRITGRVVNMSSISPRLQGGRVLVVYERERLGDIPAPPTYIQTESERFSDLLQEQISLSRDEWENKRSKNQIRYWKGILQLQLNHAQVQIEVKMNYEIVTMTE